MGLSQAMGIYGHGREKHVSSNTCSMISQEKYFEVPELKVLHTFAFSRACQRHETNRGPYCPVDQDLDRSLSLSLCLSLSLSLSEAPWKLYGKKCF